METFIDVCFGFDIILAFNTGYYKNGVLILNRKLVVLNYLKSWFFLDAVSTFPYGAVVEFRDNREFHEDNQGGSGGSGGS